MKLMLLMDIFTWKYLVFLASVGFLWNFHWVFDDSDFFIHLSLERSEWFRSDPIRKKKKFTSQYPPCFPDNGYFTYAAVHNTISDIQEPTDKYSSDISVFFPLLYRFSHPLSPIRIIPTKTAKTAETAKPPNDANDSIRKYILTFWHFVPVVLSKWQNES